jgi:hypothetical protein
MSKIFVDLPVSTAEETAYTLTSPPPDHLQYVMDE